MPARLFTIGHSNRTPGALVAMLRAAGVERVIDVRAFPRSRANPQFNIDVLPATLGAAGIAYRHAPALGGRRKERAASGEPPSPNTGWETGGFRAFADYAMTPAFEAALGELIEAAAARPTAIMCSEAVWWRCHRRIITDYLLSRGVEVRHIMSETSIRPATLTPFAEVRGDGTIVYPAGGGERPVGGLWVRDEHGD